MGEKWLDAYAKWPAGNQLIFSCALLVVVLVILFFFGVWTLQLLRAIAVARHGWPKEEGAPSPTPQEQLIAQLCAPRAALPQPVDRKEDKNKKTAEA